MLELDGFGLTMLPALAMNEDSLIVLLGHSEVTTVSTLKMLELGAQLQLVSILVLQLLLVLPKRCSVADKSTMAESVFSLEAIANTK